MAKSNTTPCPYEHLVPADPAVLCSVRWRKAARVEAGTLLAWNGAWQNKALVAYVRYAGSEVSKHGSVQHHWIVGIKALGRYYADGRQHPARRRAVREVQYTTYHGHESAPQIGRWRVVEPFTPAPKQPPLTVSPNAAGFTMQDVVPSGTTMVACDGAGPLPHTLESLLAQGAAVKAGSGFGKSAIVKLPLPEPTPEAVLADFLI